jgi:betaine-aldehyde dehydrogenase
MPHGGCGHSRFGKDMSIYSLQEYTQVEHVAFDRTGQARNLASYDLHGPQA